MHCKRPVRFLVRRRRRLTLSPGSLDLALRIPVTGTLHDSLNDEVIVRGTKSYATYTIFGRRSKV